MKIKLLVAVATAVLASSAMAQSAFQGFYGQLGTGYESDRYSNLNMTGKLVGSPNENYTVSNQNTAAVPLVAGLGYNIAATQQWLMGIGVDYSAISSSTSTYTATNPAGNNGAGVTFNNMKLQTSKRYNIFLTPGYVIDKDKLAYFKAGYSSVSIQQTYPSSYTASGVSTATTWSAGSPSSTVGGYILGLGYKQMIANGFYGFAEANYMSYSKASFSSSIRGGDGYTMTSSPSLQTMQLLVGVGYKF